MYSGCAVNQCDVFLKMTVTDLVNPLIIKPIYIIGKTTKTRKGEKKGEMTSASVHISVCIHL